MELLAGWPLAVRKKVFAIGGATVVFFSIIAWNFFVQPLAKNSAGIDRAIKTELQKKNVLQAMLNNQTKISRYSVYLAESQEVSWLIDELNNMAEQSGITIVAASPLGKQSSGDYEKITLRIEAFSKYHDLGDFVSRIESANRFIKISNLHMEPSLAGDASQQGLRISMAVSVFYKAGK